MTWARSEPRERWTLATAKSCAKKTCSAHLTPTVLTHHSIAARQHLSARVRWRPQERNLRRGLASTWSERFEYRVIAPAAGVHREKSRRQHEKGIGQHYIRMKCSGQHGREIISVRMSAVGLLGWQKRIEARHGEDLSMQHPFTFWVEQRNRANISRAPVQHVQQPNRHWPVKQRLVDGCRVCSTRENNTQNQVAPPKTRFRRHFASTRHKTARTATNTAASGYLYCFRENKKVRGAKELSVGDQHAKNPTPTEQESRERIYKAPGIREGS